MTQTFTLPSLHDHNVVCVVMDSCRWDSVQQANLQFLPSLGTFRKAMAWSAYTPSAHTALFAGHLPVVCEDSLVPYFSEPIQQLWRIQTGISRDQNKKVGLLLEGANIIEGYRRLGYYVLGVGGVSQFSEGSQLRISYPWSSFRYFGADLDEEPLAPRKKENFPLQHIDWIVEQLASRDSWFLFGNLPETHYPYDIGEGIEEKIQEKAFPLLQQCLNWRGFTTPLALNHSLLEYAPLLHQMQKKAVESIDTQLEKLLRSLQNVSKKPILLVVCADHGECFGEEYFQRPLFGHLFSVPTTLEVPLLIAEIK